MVTNQTFRTWADLQEATEYGATAISVLLAKKELGYEVVERSVKGTGIWLGHEANGFRAVTGGILRLGSDRRREPEDSATLAVLLVIGEFVGTPPTIVEEHCVRALQRLQGNGEEGRQA